MKKEKSISANMIINLIRTFLSVLYPIITFSYASRILLEDGIGKVNFAKSVISYFALIASLGISSYGIRETAKLKDDKEKLSKFVHEVFIINLITTICSYIILFGAIAVIPKFNDYKVLLLVTSITIFSQMLGMEWLMAAMEEFAFMTIRGIVFQILSLILLFVLVRDKGDYVWYAAISVLYSSGANLLNFIHCRHFVLLKRQRQYNFRKHFAPLIKMFGIALSSNIFQNLDIVMLGFMTADSTVGLYSAAVKITNIVITLLSSIATVLLPRMSYYWEKQESEKYMEVLKKTFHLLLFLVIPSTVGIYLLNENIIYIFSGAGFMDAAVTGKIMAIMVLILPINAMITQQILLPQGLDNLILRNTIIAAVVNVVVNIFLIPVRGSTGAAIATVISAIVFLGANIREANKLLHMCEVFRGISDYVVACIPLPIIWYIIKAVFANIYLQTGLMIVLSVCVYVIILLVLKNDFVMQLRGMLNKK